MAIKNESIKTIYKFFLPGLNLCYVYLGHGTMLKIQIYKWLKVVLKKENIMEKKEREEQTTSNSEPKDSKKTEIPF